MSRKREPGAFPSGSQLEVMKALWAGCSCVQDIAKELGGIPLSTAQTHLTRLETKGFARRPGGKKAGGSWIWEPAIDLQESRRRAIDNLKAEFFPGDGFHGLIEFAKAMLYGKG